MTSSGKGLRIVMNDEAAVNRWEKFCRTLQHRRVALNITRPDLAAKLGVTLSTFSKWERGARGPHPYDLMRWLNELGLDLAALTKDNEL